MVVILMFNIEMTRHSASSYNLFIPKRSSMPMLILESIANPSDQYQISITTFKDLFKLENNVNIEKKLEPPKVKEKKISSFLTD